jgi:hypothetical protein
VVGTASMGKIRFGFNSYHLRSRKLEEKLGREGGRMRQLDGFIPSVAMLLLQVDEERGETQAVPLSGVQCRRRDYCMLHRHMSQFVFLLHA